MERANIDVSTEGGETLVMLVDEKLHYIRAIAACFSDHCDQSMIDHEILDLVRQRVFGLTCGYEDLNDHDELKFNKVLELGVTNKKPKKRRNVMPLASRMSQQRMEQASFDSEPQNGERFSFDADCLFALIGPTIRMTLGHPFPER